MPILHLNQLGKGNVGKAFIGLFRDYVKKHNSLEIGSWIVSNSSSQEAILPGEYESGHRITLDLSASDQTLKQLLQASTENQLIVLANKIPLIQNQDIFDQLYSSKLGFRATVGAGLPVIPEIRAIQKQGAGILSLQACLSGTLGFLFTELEKGRLFSEVLREAYHSGFTEPDPRIDLAGGDVAKKILILSRLSGKKIEFKDLVAGALYPPAMDSLPIDIFLDQLQVLDPVFQNKLELAEKQNHTLRYVASLEHGKVSVGLKSVPKPSPLGQLKLDQKRIILKTDQEKEIIISGAGSGPEDTARDLIADLAELVQGTGSREPGEPAN